VTFEYEVEIDASPEAVWQALRDRDQIRRWHGWLIDELEDEISLIYFHEDVREDGHTLTLGDGDVFAVSDRNGKALLKLTRAPKGGNPEWDAYYEDINEGWVTFLQQLRFALERHPGADRFTKFLSTDGESVLPVDVPGQPGETYTLAAPTGEKLSGEIWFRSANQVGLTVSQWGDGLLVAVALPKGSQLILTGYAEAAFNEAAEAWQKWWPAKES
jgi:hypothetical protein